MREVAESQHIYPPTSGRIQFLLKESVTILKCKSNGLLVRVVRSKKTDKYDRAILFRYSFYTIEGESKEETLKTGHFYGQWSRLMAKKDGLW